MKHFIAIILKILTRQEKRKMGRLILLDLIIGISDIAFLGFMLFVINFYTKKDMPGASLPLQLQFNKDSLSLIIVFLLLFGVKNWAGYLVAKAQNFFFYSVASRLSERNIRDYLRDDHSRFTDIDSSVHIRRISQQPIEFSNYILINIQQVISQCILIVFTVVAIFLYHPALFFLLFLLLLPPVILLASSIRKKLRHIRSGNKITAERSIQHLYESLSGFIESNVYGRNDFFAGRYLRYQKKLNENISIQQTLQGLPSRLIEVFAVLGFFILVAINKWSAGMPGIDWLIIGVFMAASYKIIPGIVKILNSTGQIRTYEFTLNDLLPAGERNYDDADNLPAARIHSVKFEHVSFNYKHRQILKNARFEIVPGDFAGISGRSGTGKTTIVNLLLGFLEQDNGIISINDKPATGVERKHYWERISYVKQQSFFINDSILKNITLTDGAYDQAKLNEVLSFCGIDRMLVQYPEAIGKIIKENGKNISGGQRQRIMLARALYHPFDLLILDEPFGELDDEAERSILAGLQQLAAKGKMIIIITHNADSLSFCNKTIYANEE